jgi:hypothetical protein
VKAKLRKAEGEAERHRRRASYAVEQMDAFFRSQPQAPQAPDPEPQQAQYGDDQVSYVKDHARWTSRNEARQVVQQNNQDQRQRAHQAAQFVQAQEKLDRINAGGKPVFDACEVLGNAGCTFGTPMNDALFASPDFDGLVRHLAAIPGEAQRILRLTPSEQIAAVRQHESQLKTTKPAASIPASQTNAPEPMRRVAGGTATVSAVDLHDPRLSPEQFQEEWNRRFAPKGRGLIRG